MIYIKKNNIPLKLAFNDVVCEEINGKFDLTFDYPLSDEKYKKFKHLTILKAWTPKLGYQEFLIQEVTKKMGFVKVYATHKFFLAEKLFVESIGINNKNGQQAMNILVSSIKDNHNFIFSSDITKTHTYNDENKSLLQILLDGKHSIVGRYNGVLIRDNDTITLNNRRGIDTEFLIAKRKNINDLDCKINYSKLITRLYLKAKLKDKEKYITTIVESENKDLYNFTLSQFRTFDNENIQTLEQLTEKGNKIFKNEKIDIPSESFTIKPNNLINDWNLDIDDTCLIYYSDYDLHSRIKVTGYKVSPISKKYISLDFGEKKISLKSEIDSSIKDTAYNIKAETAIKLKEVATNIKHLIDDKINDINLEIDAEEIKALSKAEIESYIRTQEGQEALIQAITADVIWLKSHVVDTEILNTIVANIDYAKIKKAIVDTAFIESIISKEEFTQQFEDTSEDVTNIFTKMRDKINQIISKKIIDKNDNLKTELSSQIEQTSENFTQIYEKLEESIANNSNSIDRASSEISQTAENFTQIYRNLEKVTENNQSKLEKLTAIIRSGMQDGEAYTEWIGSDNSSVRVASGRIEMIADGVTTMKLKDGEVHATSLYVQDTIGFGNHTAQKYKQEYTIFSWTGGR